jgi:hypothetical protein
MTLATSRRPKAATVSRDAVDQARSLLQQLPEKPKDTLSLRETVAQLQDQIKAALAKGYSYEEVAQLLSGQGISISASTLKNYIPSSRRQSTAEEPAPTKTRRRRSKKQQTDESDAAEPEAAASTLLNGQQPAAETMPVSLNGTAAIDIDESEDINEPEDAADDELDALPAGRRRRSTSNAAKTRSQTRQTGGRRPTAKTTTRRRRTSEA